MHSASVAFSWQEDKNEEIKITKTFVLASKKSRFDFNCFQHQVHNVETRKRAAIALNLFSVPQAKKVWEPLL